ncbi:hypothetical protein GS4_02_02420 [Gordonia soli NBRC 108243]|uniref:Uncharacterized protein n=1 Tax=Gordonia soli NBRC 108243 TaxID=1223545 RepID=M0QDY1_9ACTN|nr:hypothetical protein GS4_02_02420 [Gordonia soli NBRC 108243]
MHEVFPTQCPNGHELGPNRILVGWDNTHLPHPCRLYVCRACDARMHDESISRPPRDPGIG